jgi:3-keto-L-gulonate-6-phosphate decarboxylase
MFSPITKGMLSQSFEVARTGVIFLVAGGISHVTAEAFEKSTVLPEIIVMGGAAATCTAVLGVGLSVFSATRDIYMNLRFRP